MHLRDIVYTAQYVGDFIHTIDIFILLGWIIYTKSCKGISGKTQFLYAFLFICRYTDLFSGFYSSYILTGKVLYILLSCLTLLMFFKFRNTYDYKNDSFWVEGLILPLLVVAALINREVLYAFSIYLEAVVMVPQLYMIYKTGHAEDIVKLYIFLIALYKCFYLAKWHLLGLFWDEFKLYAAYCQVAICSLYFFIPKGKKPQPAGHLQANVLLRQKSFLVNPFFKGKPGHLETISVIGQEVPPSIDPVKINLGEDGKY